MMATTPCTRLTARPDAERNQKDLVRLAARPPFADTRFAECTEQEEAMKRGQLILLISTAFGLANGCKYAKPSMTLCELVSLRGIDSFRPRADLGRVV